MTVSRVLLVDAFNLIRRIFEAQPGDDGKIQQVIEAASRSVARAVRQHEPSHACVVFDSHDTTWRHMLYEQYKLNRKPTPSLLMENLDEFESSFSELGISSFSLENYEADDIIATLAVGVARNDGEAIILSTDKSFLQLLCTNIRVFNHFEQTEITAEVVREKYGVEVDQLVSFWAMTGDASNNIKGVPGVGKKIAAGLLGDYGSLESILGDDTSEGPVAKVQANKAEALKCQQLVSLKTDVELGINLRSFRLRN